MFKHISVAILFISMVMTGAAAPTDKGEANCPGVWEKGECHTAPKPPSPKHGGFLDTWWDGKVGDLLASISDIFASNPTETPDSVTPPSTGDSE